MDVRKLRLSAAYDRPRRTRQIVGNGAISRRAERRDRETPFGEERADPPTLRMIGHKNKRSASRAVAALALLSTRGFPRRCGAG
jgi:hypothetical protein